MSSLWGAWELAGACELESRSSRRTRRSGCLIRLSPLSEAVRAGALTVSSASQMPPVPPPLHFLFCLILTGGNLGAPYCNRPHVTIRKLKSERFIHFLKVP